MRDVFPLAAVICLAAIPMPAGAQALDLASQVRATAEASYPADGPGAAVIVTKGDRVLFAGGRGYADVSDKAPITPDTQLRLGSITKQFTAAVVLQLVGEGRLSLSDTVGKFLPDFPDPVSRATVRQLLNHSSGIADYTKVPGWIEKNRTRSFTTSELVDIIRALPPQATPGEKWEYNNGGYVLLGAIIEKVTSRPWHEAVKHRIAEPLGLTSLGYPVSDMSPRSTARGYSLSSGVQKEVVLSNLSVAHAAGGLSASVRDLATFAQALHHGRVVPKELYTEMTSSMKLSDATTRPYGFGLRIQKIRDHVALVHGGALSGFSASSAYVPDADAFIAVLANSDDPATDTGSVVQRLAAQVVGAPIPVFKSIAMSQDRLAPLFGSYKSKAGLPRLFYSKDGKLYVSRGADQVEVYPAGEDRFFLKAPNLTWLHFVRRDDGAHVMEVYAPEIIEPQLAVRDGPLPQLLTIAPEILRSYVGLYQTDGPLIKIAYAESTGLTLQPNDGDPLPLRPTKVDEFVVDDANTRVVFNRSNGRITGIVLHRGAREMTGKLQDSSLR